jgi:hypothetical protein
MKSKEMTEALNKLSLIANEDSCSDVNLIPYYNKYSRHSSSSSIYSRTEKFYQDKNMKIENQRRLKFLEELSELRDKPIINNSFVSKVIVK